LDADNSSDGNAGMLGVPKGALTCDYYKCKAMPERFNHPGINRIVSRKFVQRQEGSLGAPI